MDRNRILMLVWAGVALAAFVAAGLLQGVLDRRTVEYDLQPPEQKLAQNEPLVSLATVAPGPLRAPLVNYLWIRAQELKDEGRYYEAYQLSEFICRLQPRSPGVWYFHAWNMAWNISAAVHTPEERWLWVNNGINLLRDSGIPLNPRTMVLYKELAWIFFNKIGGNLDEMHWEYKRRFAHEWQQVLGSPPVGSTEEVIAAFAKIAEAPLDTDPTRQREKGVFQTDVLRERILKVDPKAAEYAARLAEVDIQIDWSLLQAYNRWSNDPSVVFAADLNRRPKPGSDLQQRQQALINSSDYADARQKLLAWVRAQIIWNQHRMEPDYMLALMKRYNVPFDWRLPWPHGLYWSSLGMERGEHIDAADILELNNNRIILNSLKDLTAYGRLVYVENYDNPERPQITLMPDARYIWPTHLEHVRIIKGWVEATNRNPETEKPVTVADAPLKAGHENYLIAQMGNLLLAGRFSEASRLLQYIKQTYKPEGPEWQTDNPLEFIVPRLTREGRPTTAQAREMVGIAVQTAYYHAAIGDMQAYQTFMRDLALRIYQAYEADIPGRNSLGPFVYFAALTMRQMLVEPRVFGHNLTLPQRSELYKLASQWSAEVAPGRQYPLATIVYDGIEQPVRAEAEALGYSFEALFPEPRRLEEYREFRQQQREVLRGPAQGPVQP